MIGIASFRAALINKDRTVASSRRLPVYFRREQEERSHASSRACPPPDAETLVSASRRLCNSCVYSIHTHTHTRVRRKYIRRMLVTENNSARYRRSLETRGVRRASRSRSEEATSRGRASGFPSPTEDVTRTKRSRVRRGTRISASTKIKRKKDVVLVWTD